MCSQLVAELFRLGHRVRGVAPSSDGILPSSDPFMREHPEIEIARYKVPYYQITPYSDLSDEFRAAEGQQIRELFEVLVDQESPDIVIVGRESFAWHVPELARSFSIPSILLIHGPTTKLIADGAFPGSLGKKLIEEYGKADRIILLAQHLRSVFQELGFKNTRVIPNPVDLSRFRPRSKNVALLKEIGIRDDVVVISHLSNLKDVKRPLDIVNSAKKCLLQNPNLIYVIVGDGPMREDMERACRAKQISEKFRFVGWVDHSRIPDYINLSDVVVMPSETEIQALVYLETQACGRLLLASDIPGAREVVDDRETGLLFRKRDIADLTAKTLLAASDSALRTEIGRNARRSIQAHSLHDVAAAYEITLKEIIGEHQV
jgi:glycosyltransferase involved in cell wall biosynthesis